MQGELRAAARQLVTEIAVRVIVPKMRAAFALASAPVLALTLALAGACWTAPAPEPPQARASEVKPARRPALYDRLGGRDAIRAIVERALRHIVTDRRINTFFLNADAVALRRRLEEWLCAASGGPCRYTGKDMRTAHMGMGIGSDEFEAFVDAFEAAASEVRLHDRPRIELVLLVRRARPEILER